VTASRFTSLTGAWSGAYRYPGGRLPETVFNATIEEVDGAFTGSSVEPNLRQRSPDRVVTAEIEGVRRGQDVTFTKFMDGSGGMGHAIHYEGISDEALTHIKGSWLIPGQWSGTFFMSREDSGEEEAVRRAETVDARG
jgi:hypothetical protein